MNLWNRIYPTFVSFLGSLGLGTALTYLFGVGFFVWSESEAWAEFFLAWGPWLVGVPVASLVAHLYLRTHLGRWYLERGRVGEAVEYTGERLEHGVLRSRKEALFHRLYLGRAQIAGMDYARALETLTRGFAMPEWESLEAKYRRWQMEAALRLEDDEMLEEAWREAKRLETGDRESAALRACAAEGAALAGEEEACDRHLDEARWSEAKRPRVDFAAAVGVAQFAATDADWKHGLELLERSGDDLAESGGVPGREAEVVAVQAECFAALGRIDKAGDMLQRADEVPADGRSRARIQDVRDAAGSAGEDDDLSSGA